MIYGEIGTVLGLFGPQEVLIGRSDLISTLASDKFQMTWAWSGLISNGPK